MKKIIYLIFALPLYICAEMAIPGIANSRMSFDLSSRFTYNNDQSYWSFEQFAGLDLHKVISTERSDIGAITIQPFFYRIDKGFRVAGFYDDRHDSELLFRTTIFKFTGLGPRYPYIKLGHFEIPFGHEFTQETFGNLQQYSQGRKIGMKMDWGLAVGQELENYEYEVSLTMGSGMRWTHRDDSYAFSGRIGLPNGSYYGAGLSIFYGDVIKGKGVIERHLVALDGEYYIDSFSLGVEIYGGEINKRDTIGGLASLNWRNSDETLLIYQQYEYHNTQTMPDYHCLKAGLRYRVTKNITCSFQAISELNNSREDFLQFQIRYRF